MKFCMACAYFKRGRVTVGSSRLDGECRRRSPHGMVGDYEPTAEQPFEAAWPLVHNEDSCGEFEETGDGR